MSFPFYRRYVTFLSGECRKLTHGSPFPCERPDLKFTKTIINKNQRIKTRNLTSTEHKDLQISVVVFDFSNTDLRIFTRLCGDKETYVIGLTLE